MSVTCQQGCKVSGTPGGGGRGTSRSDVLCTHYTSCGCRDGTPLTSEEMLAIEQRRAVAQAAQAARIKVFSPNPES